MLTELGAFVYKNKAYKNKKQSCEVLMIDRCIAFIFRVE